MVDHAHLFRTILCNTVNELCPPSSRGRPSKVTFDVAFAGIQTVMKTGMPWRYLNPPDVSHITIFKTLHKWTNMGVFKLAYTRLLRLYARQRRPKFYAFDSTFVKNMYGRDVLGRNPTDRGRKATKMSVAVDVIGIPHAFFFSGANVSDFRLLEPTLDAAIVPLRSKAPLFADKGYDSSTNRNLCTGKFDLTDRIFKRRSINTRRTHARRGVVERFFAWNDKQRRLIVRYEQKIDIFSSFMFVFSGLLLSKNLASVFVRAT